MATAHSRPIRPANGTKWWLAAVKVTTISCEPPERAALIQAGEQMRLTIKCIMLLVVCSAVAPGSGASAEERTPLRGVEIAKTLTGNLVSYSPAGWADAGIHEEFHEGGIWRGIYYSRGPVEFTGHWRVRNALLCVSPDKGTIVALWFAGERCRTVGHDKKTGELFLEHLNPRHGTEALPLSVKNLRTFAEVH